MDCNVSKCTVYSTKTMFENYFEEKIDCDIVIPDYCLAAEKILKCDVTPVIISKTVEGGRLLLEGKCIINIVYQDNENAVLRSICETVQFSQSASLSEELILHKIKVKLRTSAITCRLQNSRRITVKAIVGIAVKVMGNKENEIIDSTSECEVETLYSEIERLIYSSCGETDVHISGELELSQNIAEFINGDARINITDIKPINDKIIVKGKAIVNCVYTSGENISDFEAFTHVIPFSEVIDAAGADENSVCGLDCAVYNVHCDIGNNVNNNIVNIEVDMKLSACIYTKLKIKLLKDIYSRENDLNVNHDNLLIEALYDKMEFNDSVGQSFEIDLPEARIVDIMSKTNIKNVSSTDNSIVIEGEICASIYAHNDAEYKITEKIFPFTLSKEMKHVPTVMRCEAMVDIVDSDFSMPDDNVVFKCDLSVNILMFVTEKYDIIDNFEINYDNAFERAKNKIILYYANKGENLWDIAKTYCSSIDILKRDNDIEENVLNENKMLLISHN